MTIRRSALSMVVLAALFVAACGDDSASSDQPVADDAATSDVTLPASEDTGASELTGDWILTSGTIGGSPVALVDGWDVTLSVESGELGGTAACNGYGGFVDVADGTFQVAGLNWTEMGCEPTVMDLEQSYLRSLSAVTSYVVADGVLTLSGPAIELEFDPVAPIPDTEIVGTTWVLDTIIDGDAASNSPIMGAVTLTLDDDGTLTGSTGCRRLEGEWTIAGAEVVLTSLAAIDDPLAGVCAPESEALEGFVIAVLEGGFTVEVDGSRLILMAQGDEGLSYTAG